MNILITGGTGLIGSALCSALASDGHQIHVLTRNPQKAQTRLPAEVEPYLWDAKTTQGWGHLLDEANAVINLAGQSIAGKSLSDVLTQRWTEERKQTIQASRVDAGNALVEAINKAEKKPKVFIQASAVGYYGNTGQKELIESAPSGDDFLAETCRMWEDSTEQVEAMGVRRVVIRTGLVLSAQGGMLPIILLPTRLFVGGKLGHGDQYMPWIHMEDEVNAIRFLLGNEESRGVYNLSAPRPVQQAELAQIAGQRLRRPSFLPTPAFLLQFALGEKSILVLHGQKALPEKLLNEGYAFKFNNLEAALADLT